MERMVWLSVTILLLLMLCGCATKPDAVMETDDAVRTRLLMEAMDDVGVCKPEQAVDVWVRGLTERSAAVQYAVMDDDLRKDYAKSLEKAAPDWVTGISSPWVCGYGVGQMVETAQGQQLYTISVMTEASEGPAGEYLAVLALHEEDGFWRIGGICADDGLAVYTGFE